MTTDSHPTSHPSTNAVEAFLDSVPNAVRRTDGQLLDALFREITGFEPKIWHSTQVGYGRYHYRYESGREGESFATGFSPRKANLVLYIMPGHTDFSPILARLGKHKPGKSCVYINKLADVDLSVMAELIRAGLADLATQWAVQPR